MVRRGSVDAEIEEEPRFHIQARTRDKIEAGMTPQAAERDARRRFGGLLRARERTGDADILFWLETVAQDASYAMRSLRRAPLATTVMVTSLAIAIGASTATFSILNARCCARCRIPIRSASR
ncbi:MAG TPA: permease prefix domain 1-containing protein [Vicinamibacterales bacterium]|nr:permease prefix domain 1-containing protein [Vicinamibacterales bacterium]